MQFAGGHNLSLIYLNGTIKSSFQNNPGTPCMIQTKLALISFIQQLRDDENNLYQYLAYVKARNCFGSAIDKSWLSFEKVLYIDGYLSLECFIFF